MKTQTKIKTQTTFNILFLALIISITMILFSILTNVNALNSKTKSLCNPSIIPGQIVCEQLTHKQLVDIIKAVAAKEASEPLYNMRHKYPLLKL